MSGRIEPARPIEAINLAAVADFTLGVLRVQPSLRRVSVGGREELVEPRVMQALIALAEAGGTVVSRDALIDRCWGGRIVGEDAINRCIAKVRKLAETAEPVAFTIETVSKVGYRLQVPHGLFCPPMEIDAPPLLEHSPARLPHDEANRVIDNPLRPRRALGWREAGIVIFVLVLALSGSVLTWRPATPVIRSPVTALPAPFNPPPHTIAVLAFANLSSDPGQDYLSDGLAEAVIDVLSRVNQLQVTARTSSFTFKGRPATIGEIARTLNVDSVLEGSLRRQGTHLRIDAHLSDARTGYQLWSQSYDRKLDDMLKLQDEIAGAVTDALRVKLLDTDTANASLGGTTNPQAFDAYLRGEQHLRALGAENDAALPEFRKAVALDPNFALAQGGLALSLVMVSQVFAQDQPYREMMAEAHLAADRAVQLAPALGLPHAQRAMVLRNDVTDMNAAWAEASRAKALTPGDASVERLYALIGRAAGRFNEAIDGATRAVQLDPLRLESWWALGRALTCARKYDAARFAFERGIAVLGHPPAYAAYELGGLLLKQGKPKAARQICARDPNWTGTECLAIADHALGEQAGAEAELKKLRSEDVGNALAYNYSEIYAQWHQPDVAMHWLAKARALNDNGLSDLKCDAWLDPIRDQPGFREIEQSLHFPPPE